MYELALFAGAGGGLLGSRLLGWRTVCYVENDRYCVEVLKSRMRDGMLHDAPIWDDVRTFDGRPWAGCVDIVTAGFPCQPWSGAGKGLGEKDERNLWPDTVRVIGEVRPEWCFLENVATLLSRRYVHRIFSDLAEGGYDAKWGCLSAASVGAPHIRNRLWIVAHANGVRELQSQGGEQKQWGWVGDGGKDVLSDAEYDPILYDEQRDQANAIVGGIGWWEAEPGLGRVADGMAHRLERLKALGNGQVPAVVRAAWGLLWRGMRYG